MSKYTKGPWSQDKWGCVLTPSGDCLRVEGVALSGRSTEETRANARLISAAPCQHAEMLRYLPVLERAEADPELWAKLTEGLGIATLNGYRAAILKATGEQA